MMMKCSGCGELYDESEIRFCRKITHENGDPCGSLIFPLDYTAEEPEAPEPAEGDE